MNVKEALQEIDGTKPFIELLKAAHPQIDNTVRILDLNRDNNIESKLRMRPTKQEKLAILNELITEKRDYLEKTNAMPIYEFLSKTMSENVTALEEITTRFSQLIGLIPTEMPNQMDTETVKNLMRLGDEKVEEVTADELASKLNNFGFVNPTFTTIAQVENKEQTLIAYFIYIDYEVKFLERMIEKYHQIDIDTDENIEGFNKEFTTARQVLAIHYLLNEYDIYSKTDKTEVARFVQFLTGKETGVSKINDTTIYKRVKNPLGKGEKNLDEDLRFVRNIFEKLNLQTIAAKISKEIGSKE